MNHIEYLLLHDDSRLPISLSNYPVILNPQGAVVGSICGVAFTMWIAIGAYTTTPYMSDLNFTTAGCPAGNMSTTPYPMTTTWSTTVETSPE